MTRPKTGGNGKKKEGGKTLTRKERQNIGTHTAAEEGKRKGTRMHNTDKGLEAGHKRGGTVG